MEDFSLIIKQYHHIVWSVEIILILKIQNLQAQIMEEQCVYQTVQCVIVEKSKCIKEQENYLAVLE